MSSGPRNERDDAFPPCDETAAHSRAYFVVETRANDESLHFHELVHTIQWHTLGVDRFILAYALGHLAGGGYENNPLEEIVHTLEGIFTKEPIVSQHLDRVVPALMKAAGL